MADTINVSVETVSVQEPGVSVDQTINASTETVSVQEPGVAVRSATNETITASVETITTQEPSIFVSLEAKSVVGNQVTDKDGLELIAIEATHDRLIYTWRAVASELSTLRTFKDQAGDVTKIVDSDGSWVALDRSNDNNSFNVKPPGRLKPPLENRETVVDAYSERGEPAGITSRVTIRFIPKSPRDLTGSALSESATNDEWLLEFSNGTIATEYVDRLDEGNQGDIDLELVLNDEQAKAFLESATYLDAVSVERVPDGDDFVRDNNPNNRNTVTITRPSNLGSEYLPDEGDYVVRSWRLVENAPPRWRFRMTARKT